MLRRMAAVLVAATVLVAAPLAQQPDVVEQSGAAFRAGVDLVSMNVTITDRDSRYVRDLDRDDFAIYEDGVQQDISFFNRSQLPIALSLLLDSSAQHGGPHRDAAVGGG